MQVEFDEWVTIAKENPAAFEALRLEAIDELIESAPAENRPRLRALQWRIDQERRMASTPMAGCIRISRMMWDRVVGEDGLLDRLKMLSGDYVPPQPARGHQMASIVPITSRCKSR